MNQRGSDCLNVDWLGDSVALSVPLLFPERSPRSLPALLLRFFDLVPHVLDALGKRILAVAGVSELLLPFEVSLVEGVHAHVQLRHLVIELLEPLPLQVHQHLHLLRQAHDFLLQVRFDLGRDFFDEIRSFIINNIEPVFNLQSAVLPHFSLCFLEQADQVLPGHLSILLLVRLLSRVQIGHNLQDFFIVQLLLLYLTFLVLELLVNFLHLVRYFEKSLIINHGLVPQLAERLLVMSLRLTEDVAVLSLSLLGIARLLRMMAAP